MSLPTTLLDWASLIATLVVIISALAGAYRLGSENALKSIRQANLVKRYENIYAPISSLFLTRHVTSAQGILAPYWWQRWANAKKLLKKRRIFPACVALFNKRATKEIAGVEYGDVFPMEEILQILSGNEAYADEKLLELIREADRSKYEYLQEIDGLTDEEFMLFKHIAQTYEKLQRLFSPNC